jgi:hypothetical protein
MAIYCSGGAQHPKTQLYYLIVEIITTLIKDDPNLGIVGLKTAQFLIVLV